jgi:hypothetical protein
MQHIDQSRLLHGIGGIVVKVCLEEPVFRRPLDSQSRSGHAVRGHLDVSLSYHKIDIVAWLRTAVNPEGIAASERKRYAVSLES